MWMEATTDSRYHGVVHEPHSPRCSASTDVCGNPPGCGQTFSIHHKCRESQFWLEKSREDSICHPTGFVLKLM